VIQNSAPGCASAPGIKIAITLGKMQTSALLDDATARPRVLRQCSFCEAITPHEIQPAEIPVCIPCQERALAFELDRD
jgi:hypothetical protein